MPNSRVSGSRVAQAKAKLLLASIVKMTINSSARSFTRAFAPRGHPLEPRLEGNRVKAAGCPLGAVLRGGDGSNAISLPDQPVAKIKESLNYKFGFSFGSKRKFVFVD